MLQQKQLVQCNTVLRMTFGIVNFEAADAASALSKKPGEIRVRALGSFEGLIYLFMDASQVCLNLGGGGHPLPAEHAMRP